MKVLNCEQPSSGLFFAARIEPFVQAFCCHLRLFHRVAANGGGFLGQYDRWRHYERCEKGRLWVCRLLELAQ